MVLQYFCLVFIAAVGVIQAAAAYNKLNGVSFFSHRVCGYFFMLVTTGPVMYILFTWDERYPTGVVEGGQQFYFFMLAIVAAIGFTLAVSSILKYRSLRRNDVRHDGLEALREVTFFQAIRYRFNSIVRHYKKHDDNR